MTKRKKNKDKDNGEHSASIDLDRNVLIINGTEYEVERTVATFIYDMMLYTDNIAEEYAFMARAQVKQVNA
jgi:hypothetical protein